MGNKNEKSAKQNEKTEVLISKNHFQLLYVVGRGGFGKVWKVVHRKSNKHYAMKEMSKAKIIDKKSEKSIQYERELLSQLNHPFIVNMNYAFQDTDNLYLVMDLLTGGDLRYHVSIRKKFTEEQTKFMVACILLGLDYIHSNRIIHRDIKPENLVLDEKGYVRITDFGIAKIQQADNSVETSGTPGYMAPEVMCAQNHTIAVDYFALGVLTYEFMCGIRPYTGKSRKEIKDKIIAKQIQVKGNEIPSGWSNEAADFVNRLLQRKPANRLGLRGASELREHSWLKYYNWKDLYDKKIESPYIPKSGDNFDSKYCNQQERLTDNTKERYDVLLREEKTKQVFKDFYYYFNEVDPNDKNNSKEKKIYNPHLYISNTNTTKTNTNSNSNTVVNTSTKSITEKMNNLSYMDTKLSKIKMMSSNGNSGSLLRNRLSSSNLSNNSTSASYSVSINKVGRRSGSTQI